MSLGVVLPFWLDRPDLEATRIADQAGRLGFERLWIGELASFDAFALATAVGSAWAPPRLTVGPLAVGVRSPVALAMGVASVAALTGRRVDLALGASSPEIVRGWHGRAWSRNAERARETVGAVRTLFAGGRVGGFRLREPPQDAGIALAAFGPRMTEVAAEVADEVVLNLVPPSRVAQVRATIDAARPAGRPRACLSVWVVCAVDPGPLAHRQIAAQLAVYLRPPGYGEMISALGYGDLVAAARAGTARAALADAIPIELAAAIGAIGSASEIAARLGAYFAAGADHVGIVPVTAEDPDGAGVLGAIASAGRIGP